MLLVNIRLNLKLMSLQFELSVLCATDFSLCVDKILLPALPVNELFLFPVLVLSRTLGKEIVEDGS